MKTRKLICLLLAAVLILAVAGCGSSGSEAKTEEPKTETAAAPASAEAPKSTEAPKAAETTESQSEDDYGTVVIENGDRTVTFTAMPKGVMCLNLYSAENMVMLGLGDYVVGKNVHTNPAEVPLEELSALVGAELAMRIHDYLNE